MKAYTDIKQSKKLVELGIDVNTADMWYPPSLIKYGVVNEWWENPTIIKDIEHSILKKEYYVPCWSLSALLELMPKSICIKQSEHSGYFYFLEWQFANDNSLRYVGHDGKCLIDIYSDHDVKWKDSIDTAFEMICWLKENGKI